MAAARASAPGPAGHLDLRRTIQSIIVFAVLLTPVFNAGEVLALLGGLVRAQQIAYTPIYIKAVKDICLLTIGLLCVVVLVRRGRTNVFIFPALVFLLYVLASALQSYAVDPQLPLAGLRWVFPVILCFLLVDLVDGRLLTRLANLMAGLLVCHVALQTLQLFYMSNWFGQNVFGLAGRVPGIFFIPNTASFFAILCLFLVHFYGRSKTWHTLVWVLAPVSIFLTQSGTGIIVFVLLTAMLAVGHLGARRAMPLLMLAPVAALAFLPLLPQLTGRGGDYVEISGGGRIVIMTRLLESSELFPAFFGSATNTAVSLATNVGSAAGLQELSIVADSTYASIIGNLGLLGLFGFVATGLVWALFLMYTPRLELYAFTVTFGLYGATTVVTEAFPMNLLFAVLLAHYCRQSFIPFVVRWLRPPVGAPQPDAGGRVALAGHTPDRTRMP